MKLLTWIGAGLFTALALVMMVMNLFTAPAHADTLPSSLPAMGYNSWYAMGAGVNEAAVLAQAHELVSDGLAAKGYDTVTLDDGWQAGDAPRSSSPSADLKADPAKFPHGMLWLSNQLHGMGLKFGIYTAIGNQTCVHNPGSWGHYQQDVNTFASWNVDFVKVDDCAGLPAGTSYDTEVTYFRDFSNRLHNAGMQFSEELPVIQPVGSANWWKGVKASAGFQPYVQWRVAADEHWTDPARVTVTGHLAADLHLHGYATAGHWNDLDMIVGANKASSAHPFGWTLAQQQAQLGVWAMEASPLIVSTDLAALTAGELAALSNPDMTAIDQSGAQAATGPVSGHIQALAKTVGSEHAILLVNTGTGTGSGTFTLAQLGISAPHVTGHNVWTGSPVSFSGVGVTLGAGCTTLLEVS